MTVGGTEEFQPMAPVADDIDEVAIIPMAPTPITATTASELADEMVRDVAQEYEDRLKSTVSGPRLQAAIKAYRRLAELSEWLGYPNIAKGERQLANDLAKAVDPRLLMEDGDDE